MARDPYKYHPPTALQRLDIDAVQKRYRDLDAFLKTLPNCRQRALALTALEESCMWAERGIVLSEPDEKA